MADISISGPTRPIWTATAAGPGTEAGSQEQAAAPSGAGAARTIEQLSAWLPQAVRQVVAGSPSERERLLQQVGCELAELRDTVGRLESLLQGVGRPRVPTALVNDRSRPLVGSVLFAAASRHEADRERRIDALLGVMAGLPSAPESDAREPDAPASAPGIASGSSPHQPREILISGEDPVGAVLAWLAGARLDALDRLQQRPYLPRDEPRVDMTGTAGPQDREVDLARRAPHGWCDRADRNVVLAQIELLQAFIQACDAAQSDTNPSGAAPAGMEPAGVLAFRVVQVQASELLRDGYYALLHDEPQPGQAYAAVTEGRLHLRQQLERLTHAWEQAVLQRVRDATFARGDALAHERGQLLRLGRWDDATRITRQLQDLLGVIMLVEAARGQPAGLQETASPAVDGMVEAVLAVRRRGAVADPALLVPFRTALETLRELESRSSRVSHGVVLLATAADRALGKAQAAYAYACDLIWPAHASGPFDRTLPDSEGTSPLQRAQEWLSHGDGHWFAAYPDLDRLAAERARHARRSTPQAERDLRDWAANFVQQFPAAGAAAEDARAIGGAAAEVAERLGQYGVMQNRYPSIEARVEAAYFGQQALEGFFLNQPAWLVPAM